MNNLHKFYFLLFLVLLSACKAGKPVATTDEPLEQTELSQEPRQHWKDSLKNIIHIPEDSIPPTQKDSIEEVQIKPPVKDTISFIGVGDIMLGTNFPNESYLPPYKGKDILAGVSEVLQSADITVGNQEGVILNEGGQQKNCNNPDLCYLFRSPEYMAQRLVEAGFDVMSLANNHAGDFGDAGRLNTMRVFDSLGIHHAGQASKPYATFEFDGLTIGFAAFSPNVGTVKINDYTYAKALIQKLDCLSDIVIVSFHGGAEGARYTKVTREREFFVGEDRGNVYEFAHMVIDAGADIVFGHGPHVPRAIELYKNRIIAYSLGNFATYGRFNLRGDNGLAPILKVYTDREGAFIHGKISSAIQQGEGFPALDFTHRAALRIKQLSEEDFPENEILIDQEGNITYLQSQY